jgi:prepilin-type N-terminal cleavage/methylation domain-containing protein
MAKFKNDKGLTLIELLITIAVLAVVSAIALPVISNVVSSSNSNAAVQTQGDVNDFISKYNAAGETLYANGVFSGYVDTDGDNTIDSNELIDTLAIDTGKFAVSAAGTSDVVGGTYTTKGITAATISLAASGGAQATVVYTVGTDFIAESAPFMGVTERSHLVFDTMYGQMHAVRVASPSTAMSAFLTGLNAGDKVIINGNEYAVRAHSHWDGSLITTSVDTMYGYTTLYISGWYGTYNEEVTSIQAGAAYVAPDPNTPYTFNTPGTDWRMPDGMYNTSLNSVSSYDMDGTAMLRVWQPSAALKTRLMALEVGDTVVIDGTTYTVGIAPSDLGLAVDVVFTYPMDMMISRTDVNSITL